MKCWRGSSACGLRIQTLWSLIIGASLGLISANPFLSALSQRPSQSVPRLSLVMWTTPPVMTGHCGLLPLKGFGSIVLFLIMLFPRLARSFCNQTGLLASLPYHCHLMVIGLDVVAGRSIRRYKPFGHASVAFTFFHEVGLTSVEM